MKNKDKTGLISGISKLTQSKICLATVLFLFMIFAVPIFWLIPGNSLQAKSQIEGRNLQSFSIDISSFKTAGVKLIRGQTALALNMFGELLKERVLQDQIEKAASDQFPYRISLINYTNALDRMVIKLAYFSLSDLAIPADMRSGINFWRDNSYLFYGPTPFDNSIVETIASRVQNYEDLLDTFPGINFFVFSIERIQNSQFNPLFRFNKLADGGQYLECFRQSKPSELIQGAFEINSLDEYFRYFYKTDHHLNNNGIYASYLELHEMLKQKYSDISAPLKINEEIAFPEINFVGSLARSSNYPTEGDEFKVFTFDLPPYKTYKDDKEYVYGKSKEYLAGDFSTEPFLTHYAEYYGYDDSYLEFVFDNQTDRDLLVIGDSYDNALLPLIASHYHHTYSVDLRHYGDFSLSTFLKDHPVEDILLLGSSLVAYSSSEWAINP